MQTSGSNELRAGRWEPILYGKTAEEAIDAITAIARDLSYPRSNLWSWGPERDVPHSLGYGSGGIALFFCYLAKALQAPAHASTAMLFLDEAVRALDCEYMPFGFYQGVSGICWVIDYISHTLYSETNYDIILAEYERRLLDWCRKANVRVDVNNGVSGACLYAAGRISRPSAQALYRAATDALSNAAESMSQGLSWRVSSGIASHVRSKLAGCDHPIYSTCVGFGSAGIIGSMLAACSNTDESLWPKQLIESAIAWIVATKCSDGVPRSFPVAPGLDLSPLLTPEGWYVGDLGVGTVLFNAGQLLNRDDWTKVALDAARLGANKRADDYDYKSKDFTFLSGSAGRAHLYNRLFQATGDECLAEAARYWYLQTLQCRRPGAGTGGFLMEEIDFQGVVSGAAGVGLSLLAAISPVEPTWDRAFLASCKSSPGTSEVCPIDLSSESHVMPDHGGAAINQVPMRIEVGEIQSPHEKSQVVMPESLPRLPLVSCIMPTGNRRVFALQAIQYFLRQDYPERELIILDEGDDGLLSDIGNDGRVRYERMPKGLAIGAKRNHGCKLAAGKIIAQWDDDDWYGPSRLSIQVAPLLANTADVTGLSNCLFVELEKWKFWKCSEAMFSRLFVGEVHGGTLVFRAELFNRGIHYPDVSIAEDARFLYRCYRGGARLQRISADGLFIYVRHPTCTWSMECGVYGDPSQWYSVPEPDLPAEGYPFLDSQYHLPQVTDLAAK